MMGGGADLFLLMICWCKKRQGLSQKVGVGNTKELSHSAETAKTSPLLYYM
jgi:hypothetical protein